MEERDTLILSREFESSYRQSLHKSNDSLDLEFGRLSMAISKKQFEIENVKTNESQIFTLNDNQDYSGEDLLSLENQRLRMVIEDLRSLLNFRILENNYDIGLSRLDPQYFGYVPRHSVFDFSASIEGITSNKIECSLTDLYQLLDDVTKTIEYVESDLKYTGRLTLGSLKLDVKVSVPDSPIVEKEEVVEMFLTVPSGKTVKLNEKTIDNPLFDSIPYIEDLITEAFHKVKFVSTEEIGRNDYRKVADGGKASIVTFLEYSILRNLKKEEGVRLGELEWQSLQAKTKKNTFMNKSKKMNIKEEELRRLNKNISQQTVKNAKDRELLEEELELFQQKEAECIRNLTTKIEYITKVLQEIEDTRAEPKTDKSILNKSHNSRVYEAPSITEEIPIETQIRELEKELVRLEIEYKTSKIPETLESISTSITRVKSSLLNLQSLKAIKNTERTSSAVRNALKRADKQWENQDVTNSPKTGSTKHTESSKLSNKLPRFIPSRPNNILLSPIRRLEASTSKLDVSTLNSPSRRISPMVRNETHTDSELKKYLRKKDEMLNDREEEIKIEEKRLQSLWENIPEGKEMIPVIQVEIFEYRKLRQEMHRKLEAIEREKYEWRERYRELEGKEKDIKEIELKLREKEVEFEGKKEILSEKLDWLKRKLMVDDLVSIFN